MTADLFAIPAVPAAGAPRARVTIGGSEVVAVAVSVQLGLAPGVDGGTVLLPPGAAADIDAPVQVALGDASTGPTPVLSGTVGAIRTAADGTHEARVGAASERLAALRVDASFEQQSAADVLADLCGRAGVAAGELASGPTYPFLVLHRGLSAWRHAALLAERQGHAAWVDETGAVRLGPLAPGDVAASFAWGVDVLALRLDRARTQAGPTVVGEGAAGTDGSDAWAWTVADPGPVKAGDGGGLQADRSLRTPEAVQAAAEAAAGRAAAAATVASVTVPIAPEVRPGAGVSVDDVPGVGTLAGPVIAVRHEHGRASGAFQPSTTTIRLLATAGALGALAGGLP